MDEIDMAIELVRNRVLHRSHRLLACLRMGIDGKVSIEQRVRFADGHRDAEPVARRCHSRRVDPSLLEPRVDSCDALCGRCDQLLNLS